MDSWVRFLSALPILKEVFMSEFKAYFDALDSANSKIKLAEKIESSGNAGTNAALIAIAKSLILVAKSISAFRG